MDELKLATDDVELTVHPAHGGDLHAIVDRASGVDVLFKAHWEPSEIPALGGDRTEWQDDYRGGWQLLLPNGGDESERNGTMWGFHGEASTVPWAVTAASATSAEMTVTLQTAPLRVHRTLTLRGPTVRVSERVENMSDADAEVMYVHHPAFGAPLIDDGARLSTGARTVVTDPLGPGTVARADARAPWPTLPTPDGGIDLRDVPGKAQPRAVMAYLTEFDEPYFAISNRSIGLGVAVRWTEDPFEHAWLWQEIYSSPGQPWEAKACAMAVEPASTFPGHGLDFVNRQGDRGLIVPAGGVVEAALELTLFTPQADAEVVGVDWGGAVHFSP